MTTFGSRLSNARRAAGLTQAELGHRAGCAGQTISNYERGTVASPKSHHVVALARELGIAASDLLGDTPVDTSEDHLVPVSPTVRQAAERHHLDAVGLRKLANAEREMGPFEDYELQLMASIVRRNTPPSKPSKRHRGRPRRGA